MVILGAGCAGLSACVALLEAGFTGSILLADARREYLDDRTWCFWDVEPTPFTHLARASWDSWGVRAGTDTVRASAPTTPYVCIAATDFYSFALESIADRPNVELRLGERVSKVEEVGDLVHVTASEGQIFARQVVDSRGLMPSSASGADAAAHSTWIPQQFVGLHIVATTAVFDPSDCRLMDFGVDQSGGLRFMYVLPVSPFEALIENVYMAETLLDRLGHRREIDAYLNSEFGLDEAQYHVLGEERGCIPMTDQRFVSRVSARITRLGMAGGATRPSTGYTFLGIQRSCQILVDRLVGGAPDAREPNCSLLDAVFLRFLADDPRRAPQVFAMLFGRVATPSLVRFLSERSGLRDHIRLILALPKLPFLRSAAKVLINRVTRGRRH